MTRLLTRMAGLLLLIATVAGGASAAKAGLNDWTSRGGPPGLVYSVVLDPVNAGVMYAGTSTGGVFKSTDEGRNWTSSGQGLGTPNYVVRAFVEPNDPLFSFYQWNLNIIRASAAWDISIGKDNITVAIIDTGVDLSHPDLANKVLPGINAMDPALPPRR